MENQLTIEVDKNQRKLLIQYDNTDSSFICSYTNLDYTLMSIAWCCSNDIKFKSYDDICIVNFGNVVRIYSNLCDEYIETTYQDIKAAIDGLFESMYKMENNKIFNFYRI